MPNPNESNAIEWRDVAIVAFLEDHPVFMSSAKPLDLFETFCELVGGELEDRSLVEIREEIRNLRWKLFETEEAKRIFAEGVGLKASDV